MMATRAEVVIAGGGLAGLALAVALREALGAGFRVIVVDPAFAAPVRRAGRATAIAAAARRFFETIDVWTPVGPRAQPILDMVVTDSRVDDPYRPVFLTFDGEIEPGEPFAHMVEDHDLLSSLQARAEALGVTLVADRTMDFSPGRSSVTARLASGGTIETTLLVGADGARSQLRELAGITLSGWDYGQSGIVTTVSHEREHDGRAVEHFLPAGPFARLPLTGRRSSIVWTERTGTAERMVGLPDNAFLAELEQRFGHELGDITLSGGRAAYPLSMRIARRFVADRLALVGDAAHVIHPIAGQGLNMGLRDIAALAECIVDTARLGLDFGDPETLDRYERWRRFDTVAMGFVTDALNRLFSNDLAPIRLLRDVGLGLVDRLPPAKRYFIREASGMSGDTPRLLRGAVL